MTGPCGERQAALREACASEGADTVLIQHPPNIRYLTGFTGSAGVLLLAPSGTVLVTDFRYATQAPQEVGAEVRLETDRVSIWERLRKVVAGLPGETLGYEPHVATGRDLEKIRGLRPRLVALPELTERLRAAKAPAEVAAIRAAAALAEEALAETLPLVHPGQSEYEVAALLEGALRRRGSEWHPFPTIVASGPRSALPHARTSERHVEAGDLLLLDFGARVDGYCADLTRTFVVGRAADDRQRTVYQLVLEAERRALGGIRAGQPSREADALARDVIAAHGFGDAFGHSLGHGLGLEVHEAPRVSPVVDTPLPAGAVVTIEPGVYLPGWGGVRLEDDVHLAPDGPVLLSRGAGPLLELR